MYFLFWETVLDYLKVARFHDMMQVINFLGLRDQFSLQNHLVSSLILVTRLTRMETKWNKSSMLAKKKERKKKLVTRNSRANWPFWLPFGDFFLSSWHKLFGHNACSTNPLCSTGYLFANEDAMLPYFLSCVSKCLFWALLRLDMKIKVILFNE